MQIIRPAYAQVDIGQVWQLSPQHGGAGSLSGLISSFLPRALLVAGIIFFFLVVFAGVSMISNAGSGNAQNAEKAKAFFTYAIIGLVIIFGAFFILQIINYVTGGSLGGLLGT